MVVRATSFSYPPKGFDLPPKPASDDNPWQGYLDVLEIVGRPPITSPAALRVSEFELAYERLSQRQLTAEQLAADFAAKNPAEPLPDTYKDWQRACWGRPSWLRRPYGWGGGGGCQPSWGGGRYPHGRYNTGPRGC